MAEINEPLDGEFDGIGVVFNMATDTVIVLNVIPSGPSDKAGVVAGDRIVRINDSLVAGQQIAQREIMRRLRGKRGSEVRLGLERRGIDELVEVTVVRDKIPIRSLTAALMLTGDIAFVKLDQFARTSHTELLEALSTLRTQGMRKLIPRPAGQFGRVPRPGDRHRQRVPARRQTDRLYRRPQPPAHRTIQRRHGQCRRPRPGGARRRGKRLVERNPRRSVAGQRPRNDHRPPFVRQGARPTADSLRRRFGAAADRRPLLHPTGRSIQKPYTSGDAESYDADIWNRYQHNEFFSADSIRFDDALRRTTPGGKVVYGGGGIMPDIFVPLDTTDLTKYYLEVSGRNILYRYTIEYADAHRKALNAVRTTADLRALLDADRGLVDDFIRYAARKGVAPRYGDIARSRQLMEAQLKAYIGRNTSLEDSGYFLSIYPEDEVIVRAIGELEHPTIPTVKAAEAVAEGEPAEEQPAEEEPAEEAPHD